LAGTALLPLSAVLIGMGAAKGIFAPTAALRFITAPARRNGGRVSAFAGCGHGHPLMRRLVSTLLLALTRARSQATLSARPGALFSSVEQR